jgi:sec-independent protein translocase protein TatA
MVAAAGPFGLGPMELVIILLVLVMLFGATRLADLGGSLGKGIKEFKKSVRDDDEDEPVSSSTTATASAPSTSAQPVTASAPPVAPSNGVETVSAVKCPSCGTLNPVGSRHCNQCGASLVAPVT